MIEKLYLEIPIIASFLITLFLIPFWIKRAKKCNIAGRDIHKIKKPKIAEAGGVTVITGFLIGTLIYLAINTFIFRTEANFIEILATLVSILSISLIGLIDDILGWKVGLSKRIRLIFVFFASIPLIAINAGRSDVLLPFIGSLDLGFAYPLIIIPLGIVGASTTFNFLAGYNGQETGQGIIILSALALTAYLTGNAWLSIICLIMIGSLFAFLIFNHYPSKILPGDSLTYTVGALIPIIAILGNFEKIAVFFFTPYILEVGLKLRGRLKKESFGKPLKDGSLDLRYEKIYSLNHLTILIMKKLRIKPTEKKVVYAIWAFQLIIVFLDS